MSRNILLLMMGGSGTRFGADIPKQFVEVEGKPTFSYLVEKYDSLGFGDEMIIVCHHSWIEFTQRWIENLGINTPFSVVSGGSSRSESVKNGLAKAAEQAKANDVVFIHDVTHPYVDDSSLDQLASAARKWGGATMGECQYDTCYQIDPNTKMLEAVIPRERIVSGASPEAFEFGRIWGLYKDMTIEELEQYTSAGALALAHDIPMEVVPTDLINLKITYRHDMEVFKKLFHNYYF